LSKFKVTLLGEVVINYGCFFHKLTLGTKLRNKGERYVFEGLNYNFLRKKNRKRKLNCNWLLQVVIAPTQLEWELRNIVFSTSAEGKNSLNCPVVET
jgi:hypothetical protein